MEMDTKWVEVFNYNVLPHSQLVREHSDRFSFKGIHRDHAIFEYVLEHRDYGTALMLRMKELVNAYRENINQLSGIKTARVSIKRKHGDTYYSNNDHHLWYFSLHFDKPTQRPNKKSAPEIADLDRFWMLKAGKYFVMQGGSQIHLRDFDPNLGVLVVEAEVSAYLVEKSGGLNEVSNKTYGRMLHVLKDYLKVNFIEYRIKEKHTKVERTYAGYAGEELFFVEEKIIE